MPSEGANLLIAWVEGFGVAEGTTVAGIVLATDWTDVGSVVIEDDGDGHGERKAGTGCVVAGAGAGAGAECRRRFATPRLGNSWDASSTLAPDARGVI